MNNSDYLGAYFDNEYQSIIIQGFEVFREPIYTIYQNYCLVEGLDRESKRIYQLIHLLIVQFLFNLDHGQILSMCFLNNMEIIKEKILQLNPSIPSRSWAYLHLSKILECNRSIFNSLMENFIDYFYTNISKNALEKYMFHNINSKKRITPPFELFIGNIPPSTLFPTVDVFTRAELMPYFNARIFLFIKHLSSINEFVGEIKKAEYENEKYIFKFAGKLGFITGAPGKNAFYNYFTRIETLIGDMENNLDYILAINKIHDLTVVSVDGTHIPADKRDKTASNGVGSRGSFYGQKCSIGAGTYCLPIRAITESGNTADAALFNITMNPIQDLANISGQDIWVQTADAGYTSTYIIEDIIANDSVPFIDINPRNSKLLKKLKEKAGKLAKLSKLAIKNGLNMSERKKWTDEVQSYSESMEKPILYKEKSKILRKILHKYEIKAKSRGLTKKEQQLEKRLRKEVMNARKEIRMHGTECDRIIGLSIIPQGTVSWFLVYHIRGQNEGINGIKKKRGNLIGDGQSTSWTIGLFKIGNRIQTNMVLIKASVYVNFMITGKKHHLMRRIYNWIISIFCWSFFW